MEIAEVELGTRTVRRVFWRLVPLLWVLYVLNYVDRMNVALAKLQMNSDLQFSEAVYGFGASAFFLGYFLFEVPSNMILERVGARLWIARIMITWGIISAAMMAVQGEWSFYILRFLLGTAEAGFLPGILLYLTYWVPARERARAMAWFLTSTTLSVVIGAVVGGLVLDKLGGVGGLKAWQWLFLIEGTPTVVLGVGVLFWLPDRPAKARWLDGQQRAWLEATLAAERQASEARHHTAMWQAFASPMVWLLAMVYFMLILGYWGVGLWAPTMFKAEYLALVPASRHADLVAAFLSAVPYLAASVALVLVARYSDRTGDRKWPVVAGALVGAAGLLIVCGAVKLGGTGALGLMLAGFTVAATGIWGTLGPFWSLPPLFVQGSAAAAAIAWINSMGNLGGGFLGPNIMGGLEKRYGSFVPGMLVDAAALVVCAGLMLAVRRGDRPVAASR